MNDGKHEIGEQAKLVRKMILTSGNQAVLNQAVYTTTRSFQVGHYGFTLTYEVDLF